MPFPACPVRSGADKTIGGILRKSMEERIIGRADATLQVRLPGPARIVLDEAPCRFQKRIAHMKPTNCRLSEKL